MPALWSLISVILSAEPLYYIQSWYQNSCYCLHGKSLALAKTEHFFMWVAICWDLIHISVEIHLCRSVLSFILVLERIKEERYTDRLVFEHLTFLTKSYSKQERNKGQTHSHHLNTTQEERLDRKIKHLASLKMIYWSPGSSYSFTSFSRKAKPKIKQYNNDKNKTKRNKQNQ